MNQNTQRTEQDPRNMLTASALAAAGATSIAYGLSRRTLLGKALGVVPGVYLGLQGAATVKGESVGSMIKRVRGGAVEQTVRIARPPKEVYEFVRDFKNLSKFMTHTHDVREDDDGRVHWVVKIANGLKLEYDGEVIDDVPGKLFTYRSAPEEPFEETGTIRFDPADGNGTQVTMRIAWTFPSGPAGAAAAKALEPMTESLLADELQTLKRSLEGQTPTTAH
jgi:uncharacterized membrane protein